MIYEITPYVGVGAVIFGMSQEEVRNAINGDVIPFKKTSESEMLTDSFEGKGIHVYYKKTGVCEAIEFGTPAEPLFMGEKMIGQSFNAVKCMFEELDDSLDVDETGFTSYKFGIGVFVPTLKKSKCEPIQGVIVFEKGYY